MLGPPRIVPPRNIAWLCQESDKAIAEIEYGEDTGAKGMAMFWLGRVHRKYTASGVEVDSKQLSGTNRVLGPPKGVSTLGTSLLNFAIGTPGCDCVREEPCLVYWCTCNVTTSGCANGCTI